MTTQDKTLQDINDPKYLKVLEQEQAEVEEKIFRLTKYPEFPAYRQTLVELQEALKNVCIRAPEVERVRDCQSKFELLESLLSVTDNVSK